MKLADVSWEYRKSGRVVSPGLVGGEVLKTVTLEGSASSAELTVMRPAKPVCCEPVPVMAPVYSEPPSVNSGSCGLPPYRCRRSI